MGLISFHRNYASPDFSRWHWRWMHWCVFDRDCRSWGCPPRIYFHIFRFYIELNRKKPCDSDLLTSPAVADWPDSPVGRTGSTTAPADTGAASVRDTSD